MQVINTIYSAYIKCLTYINSVIFYNNRNIDLEKGLWNEYESEYDNYLNYDSYDSYSSNSSEEYPEYIGVQRKSINFTPLGYL